MDNLKLITEIRDTFKEVRDDVNGESIALYRIASFFNRIEQILTNYIDEVKLFEKEGLVK